MSFVYMFVFFPIYAQFGGGKGGAKIMFSKLFRPAAVSFGTCSSVATIPTNMEVADETGISKDVTDIVLPMGATMHMDGSAMSAIIKVAFLFGVFGLDLSLIHICCGVDRAGGQFGFCAVPDAPVVARAAPHFGEEPCISGTRGSGAVFLDVYKRQLPAPCSDRVRCP